LAQSVVLTYSQRKHCSAVANAAMNFNPTMGIHFPVANSYTKLHGIFKGSYKKDFSKISVALSLKDLLN
jgi:hypothetical protein